MESPQLSVFQKKQAIKQMKAARKMVTAFTELIEGDHDISVGGWLDFYTYEPLKCGIDQLRAVIEALNILTTEGEELHWEFRLFAKDGMITTWADGSAADEDMVALVDNEGDDNE